MNILEKLFGTAARVKLMRLFLFNPTNSFDVETIIVRVKEASVLVKKELDLLAHIGMIQRKPVYITIPETKTAPAKRKKVSGWILNNEFEYVNELKSFLLNTRLARNSDIIKSLQKSGRMKLIILAGVFTQNQDSRLDLFVVGDGIKKSTLEHAIQVLESEIGKELRYVWFETGEFNYRVSMYDKLVRDVLDFPHEKILNRLNIAE